MISNPALPTLRGNRTRMHSFADAIQYQGGVITFFQFQEANTMAERDLGSTFLLPHTHLYKPDRVSCFFFCSSFINNFLLLYLLGKWHIWIWLLINKRASDGSPSYLILNIFVIYLYLLVVGKTKWTVTKNTYFYLKFN